MNMQSVTAFNEEDHDPDLIVWDGEESDSDREGDGWSSMDYSRLSWYYCVWH